MVGKHLLLIAGIPATGKSYFCAWLAREHGYVHVDIEEASRLKDLGLVTVWNACFQTGDVSGLLIALRALGPHVVLDWGFPPQWLDIVRKMQRGSMEVWWFDGDRAKAREEFVRRQTVPMSALEVQMKNIQSRWEDIQKLFGPNCLDVIDSSSHRMSPEQIWRHIARDAA